jgi:hypothetical protein
MKRATKQHKKQQQQRLQKSGEWGKGGIATGGGEDQWRHRDLC